jgi:hypothetical protein
MMVRCARCGRVTGEAREGEVSGALCLGCAMPRCHRCGAPGQVPIRPHGVALCSACYCAELAVSVDTGEAVPA